MFQHDGTLDEVDPEIAQIIRSEKERQVRRAPVADCWAASHSRGLGVWLPPQLWMQLTSSPVKRAGHDSLSSQVTGLELIASENFTSRAVMTAVGSCMTNK